MEGLESPCAILSLSSSGSPKPGTAAVGPEGLLEPSGLELKEAAGQGMGQGKGQSSQLACKCFSGSWGSAELGLQRLGKILV